nr:reverse transcriptase domain-containing protein [Tanacetum cinerariifolium]
MADNRTMAQMLQAPIEGYEDAIVVPQINANDFELKHTLINLVQSNQFTERQDPHNHLRFFNKITSTFRHPEVPNTTVKLLLFPFSVEGEARIWLDKEPPRSILTWEDLVSKFIKQFFPPSKTTHLCNEITNFLQKSNETFKEAWECFKDLLRQYPHHGFLELHQLDTFYNALNPNDQDALDSTAEGNFLDKIPRECLSIIESKSKFRYSRSRVTDVSANTNAPLLPSFSHLNSFDLQQIAASLKDKLDIRMNRFEISLNNMKNSIITPTAPLKAIKKNLYNKPSSSSSLPSNTIPNPKGEAKAITTKSGISYKEPPIPPPGEDQQEPIEETTDTELPSPKDIQPPLVQVEVQVDKLAEEPSVVIAKAKANLPYPSRLQKDFADALIHMPKFAPMFNKLLNNKDKLIELTKMPLNENCSAVVLKKFPEKLELADRTISKPMGVAENVFVKVGKFYFPADFVVLDFVADLRVLLILGRPFLSTAHKIEQINKIDFINAGGIDFESEEIEDILNDDSIPFGVEDSPFNMEEDILFLESLLRDDPIPPHLNQKKLPIEETDHSLNMGYKHFNTNLLTKDVAESNSTIISNPLSDIKSNSDESTSNHNTIKNDYFDEFYGPFTPIHILEEERTRREHADCINRMEMLFIINQSPHNPTNDNTNVKSFSSFPNQENKPRQEEIDVVSETNDVLPLSEDDLDEEVDAIDDLRVDNVIQNSEHEYSESEDSDFDNPLLLLPPPKPPDKEFDFKINFEKEISVVRNVIVNTRMKFNNENDVFMFIMFAKKFSLLSAKSEDTIFDPGLFPRDWSILVYEFLSGFQDLHILSLILVWGSPYPLIYIAYPLFFRLYALIVNIEDNV